MSELITLTEIEAMGLNSECNMADGHAYYDHSPAQRKIIQNLPFLWETATKKKHQDAEEEFKLAFSQLAFCPSLINYHSFKICPTASNSIDTLATWAKEKNLKTLLIEPTFDNLALILKRRGVPLDSISEEELPLLISGLMTKDFDALFLVNPNNPTGKNLSEDEFKAVVTWCRKNNKVLFLDNTFRFFVAQTFDTYQILLDSGVTFISLEDTGKVWPTQEIKASLIFFSKNIHREMHLIYDEIYLCVSNFQLELLKHFFWDTIEKGANETIWKQVAQRRAQFREVIKDSIFDIHPVATDSKISVEWVQIKDQMLTDDMALQLLKQKGLVVLPGRNFFWNSTGSKSHTDCLRFSLLKPTEQFNKGLLILDQFLSPLKSAVVA